MYYTSFAACDLKAHACRGVSGKHPASIARLHVQGEVLDTLRHGSGKHTCSNGDTYDGAWQYDKRHGRGTAKFARGVCYQGQWKEDMAHGCVAEDCTRLCDQSHWICTAHSSCGLDDSGGTQVRPDRPHLPTTQQAEQ